MVESLKELNQICQKPRYREAGNWMARYLVRDAALFITWLLLHTTITANQVTLISLIIGIAGGLWLALQGDIPFLIGVFALQIWYLLDHVDGQIARYRKTASLTGRFFDFTTHHIIHGILFFCLGAYCFYKTNQPLFIFWGFATSLAGMMFNLIHDTKYKTFFEKLLTMKSIRVKEPEEKKQQAKVAMTASSGKKTFSLTHKLFEIHVAMNVLTFAAVLQCSILKSVDFRFLLFIFYGISVPILAVTKISYLIVKRKIDQEFDSFFSSNE